jgi:hypothetical protein
MPGAQPRRPFGSRIGSTARRGAYSPPGVPGVYRVPRSRTVTVTSDPGRPAVGAPVWVQPEDVEAEAAVSSIFHTQHDDGSPYLLYQETVAGGTSAITGHYEGGTIRWESQSVILKPNIIDAYPVSPSPPPGMSVEYETPMGTLLTARIASRLFNEDDFLGPPTSHIYEIPEAALVPGEPVGVTTGPSYHVGGTQVFTVSTVGSHAFTTPDQTFPASEKVGWRFCSSYSANETVPPVGLQWQTRVIDSTAAPNAIKVYYTYRPPRYRFV